jgi:hypothetical protein
MHGKNVVNPQVEDGLCHRRVLGLCREGGDNISEQADCISSLFLKGGTGKPVGYVSFGSRAFLRGGCWLPSNSPTPVI